MRILLFIAFPLFLFQHSFAQNETVLKKQIFFFFEAMQKNDTAALSGLMHPDCELKTIYQDSVIKVRTEKRSEFLEMMTHPLPEKWEEKLISYVFYQDELLATVNTEYEFFYNGKLLHTGINQFTFSINSSHQWKLISLIDTRYKAGSGDTTFIDKQKSASLQINEKTDNWHKAASDARLDDFFSFMSDSCIYKGTDQSERWNKKEFYDFCKSYFDKGKAWDFKPFDRKIKYDDNLQTAWFDEKLDTWMGVCKATGILQKENGEWKLVLYDLSVTIDNDKIKEFIDLTSK